MNICIYIYIYQFSEAYAASEYTCVPSRLISIYLDAIQFGSISSKVAKRIARALSLDPAVATSTGHITMTESTLRLLVGRSAHDMRFATFELIELNWTETNLIDLNRLELD